MLNIMGEIPKLIKKYEEDKEFITKRFDEIDKTLKELKELIKENKKEDD